jgi:diguanylate cyclase (GGDEF)-like protein
MFDIDKFKVVNDDFGHLCGDEVLRDLTALFRGFVRLHDTFARWGGDEFVVVLTNTPVEGALRFAEKLRAEAERHSFRSVARVTCSFGVAQWSKDEAAVLFRGRVDSAMYSAKRLGRNRVEAACAAPPLTRES